MPPNRDTPAMRQYASFKAKHPDCLLFFRMGDFYELFDDDAVKAHRILGITLTQRSEGIPMAGVPYHSAESYFRRAIAQGCRVAVCDQIQDAREVPGGKVIERALTRILTPGTLVDEALLDESAPNTLASVCFLDAGDEPSGRVGAATVELSTGEFTLFDCLAGELVDELARRGVSEALYAEPSAASAGAPPPRVKRVLEALSLSGTPRPGWHFRRAEALEALHGQYAVSTLAGFGLTEDDPAIPAAGAIIRYLGEVQALETSGKPTSEGVSSGTPNAFIVRPRSLSHLRPPRRERPGDTLALDAVSLRALEVERTIRAGGGASAGAPGGREGGSLLGLFLSSEGGARPPATPMGKRLLREWLCRPPARLETIEARLSCVEALVNDPALAEALHGALRGVQDVPRIAARVGLGRAPPRDLVSLGRSLSRLGAAEEALAGSRAFEAHARALGSVRGALAPVAEEIARTCNDDAPAHLREGGLVRAGVDAALDEARGLRASAGRWLAEYQSRLAAEHDLPGLKVGYNKVFGFYIELPQAQARRAPAVFTRRQTLKGAERYITPELKEHEDKVLHAEERAVQREQEIFLRLCARVASCTDACADAARTLAELDVLSAFASRAAARGWARPLIVDEPVLRLTQARHPVLEEILADRFVPNDCALGARRGPVAGGDGPYDAATLALITGPNMAGKSTYIRMVALNVLLAHAGSFVPAQHAVVGLTDRIFTRIGADDALHAGQSTFMVEMIETANILNHAGARSLVILDEIGRGTSTLDGLSLAWAIAEHLAGAPARARGKAPPAPRTLFATHYHELTDLADRLPGRVQNLHVSVREWEGQVIFLHRILPGRSSRSYGIHVARLAGLPASVVERADALLESLTVQHAAPGGSPAVPPPPHAEGNGQMTLFREYFDHPAIGEIKALDLDSITPLEAFDALRRLKQGVDSPAARPGE